MCPRWFSNLISRPLDRFRQAEVLTATHFAQDNVANYQLELSTGATKLVWPDFTFGDMELPRGRILSVSPSLSFWIDRVAKPFVYSYRDTGED